MIISHSTSHPLENFYQFIKTVIHFFFELIEPSLKSIEAPVDSIYKFILVGRVHNPILAIENLERYEKKHNCS